MKIEIFEGSKPNKKGWYIVRYKSPAGGYGWGDDIFDGNEWLYYKQRVTHYAERPLFD